MDSAKRVISGTWGEVWLDGDKVSECYGLQAKVSFNKEDIALCGQMASDKKVKMCIRDRLRSFRHCGRARAEDLSVRPSQGDGH